MKIGIITHYWEANFGANVQALATFHFLKNQGHEPIMLNYRPHKLEKHIYEHILPEQIKLHTQFVDEFLEQSHVLRNDNDLIEYCNQQHLDIIIAGSDSILRIKKSVKTEDGSFPNSFWLKWTNRLKEPHPRVGYLAVSTEGSYYPLLNKETKKAISQALKSVDYVSVRDRWSKSMVRYVTKKAVDPIICPDPVSVLNDVFEVPKKYSVEPESQKKQYVLLTVSPKYFSKAWLKRFRALLRSRNLSLYTLPTPGREFELNADKVLKLPMHPLSWYSWIKNAAGVISSNFHPIACSVFNQVPFISIDICGQMYFRSFGIRQTSKSYDLCMDIKAESRSYLPMQARFFLSPERAIYLLENWNLKLVDEYRSLSRKKYSHTLKDIMCDLG